MTSKFSPTLHQLSYKAKPGAGGKDINGTPSEN